VARSRGWDEKRSAFALKELPQESPGFVS
jgi:hypothetical protein